MNIRVDDGAILADDNVASKVRSSLIWSAVRNWGSRLVGFVIYFQLVRLLDPASIGAFAAAFAVFAFLELFVDQGLGDAILQRPTVSQGQLNTVFLLNFLVSLLVVGGIWLCAPLVEQGMKIHGLSNILRIGSLSLLINALGFCQLALFRREFQFKRLAMRGLVSTLAGGVAGVALAWLGFGVWALVAQLLVAAVVNLAMLWWRSRWYPSRELDFSGLGQMSRFGINILGVRVIEFSNYRLIDLAVGFWLGVVSLGMYSVGSKLYYIFAQLLGSVLLDVAMPAFSRMAGDRVRMREVYYQAVTMTVFVAVPVWILVAALAPELCHVAFGARWAGSEHILVPLAFLGAAQAVQYYDSTILNACGKPSHSLLLSSLKAVATLISIWIAHSYSLLAIVIGCALAQVALMPLSYWLVRHALAISLREWLGRILPFLAAVVVLWGGIYLLAEPCASWPPLLALVFKGGVGAVLYLGTLGLFARQRLMGLLVAIRSLKHG